MKNDKPIIIYPRGGGPHAVVDLEGLDGIIVTMVDEVQVEGEPKKYSKYKIPWSASIGDKIKPFEGEGPALDIMEQVKNG